ncbi:MAG: hypothetical protein DRP08_05980 [Candidatus Aenigmatarchaeota archaeon]|nr:MAG: hypothetical protein DRP08_05980 [Candidatus Aenigmarchaeota archaeon]
MLIYANNIVNVSSSIIIASSIIITDGLRTLERLVVTASRMKSLASDKLASTITTAKKTRQS